MSPESAKGLTDREQAELEVKRLRLHGINTNARRKALYQIMRTHQDDFDRILRATKAHMIEETTPRIQREVANMTREQVDNVLRSRDSRRRKRRHQAQFRKRYGNKFTGG